MVKDQLTKVLKLPDEYEVKARLFPAFLALVPVAAVAFGCYQVELKVHTAFTGLLAYVGVFFLLANICRELGKRHEARLFEKWGGKPSTQLLRHANQTLDVVTKARYHRFLEKALGVSFPKANEEAMSQDAADQIYEGAVRYLLTKTRDKKKFFLLFGENVSYGFRRNGYGIRWIAVLISLLSLVWIAFASQVLSVTGLDLSRGADIATGPAVAALIAFVAISIWMFFFTERTIKTASFSYADTLLRCCDSLPRKR